MSLGLEETFFETTTKKREESKVHVPEMYRLGKMCGVTRNARIRNKYIRINL